MNNKAIGVTLQAGHDRLDGLAAQLNMLSNDMLDIQEHTMKNTSANGESLSVMACQRLFNDAVPILQEMMVDLHRVGNSLDLAYLAVLKLTNKQKGIAMNNQNTIHGQKPLTFIRETVEAIQSINETPTRVYVGRLGDARELSPLELAQKYAGEILAAVTALEGGDDHDSSD
ncbi:hypothetical protein [Lacticaseibacillus paracasei]|uniref:hypothetical protein n=1 Tax=Lacticaseibacillus paracasei TaxID=1597 RepID=UPI0034A1763D